MLEQAGHIPAYERRAGRVLAGWTLVCHTMLIHMVANSVWHSISERCPPPSPSQQSDRSGLGLVT